MVSLAVWFVGFRRRVILTVLALSGNSAAIAYGSSRNPLLFEAITNLYWRPEMKSLVAALTLICAFSHATAQESAVEISDGTPAAKIPDEAHDAMARFVGRWKHKSKINGQMAGPGSGTRRWTADETALLIEGKIDGVGSVAGITGWNPRLKAIVETWHSSDARTLEVVYPLSGMGSERWLGTIRWGHADGTTSEGLCSIEFNEQGWEWTAHWEEGGKSITRKGYTSRAP